MGPRSEESIIRCELEMAERALKLQTRRCRQLVTEFTRKLQAKEHQLVSERQLRDEQLSRVLRSLLVFESRLKQEQTLLRHELSERDDLISRQNKEITRLKFTIQFCKTCSQFCTTTNLDSCDSSSEYCVEGWESGSEFASVADSNLIENSSSGEENNLKVTFDKGNTMMNCTRYKKHIPRRTTGTYFEVLKLRESQPDTCEEFVKDGQEESEKNRDSITDDTNCFSNRMDSLHGIRKTPSPTEEKSVSTNTSTDSEFGHRQGKEKKKLITETITVFDGGENEANDNWYASASDGEDDDQRDIYRNNPVLECMNQILLQNINDTNNTPPQSPEMERNHKSKTQKRVKFIDEKQDQSVSYVDAIELKKQQQEEEDEYYETPIQVSNNFYEVPQSIYSNDYEQILSKCGGDSVQSWSKENVQEHQINRMTTQKMSLVKTNNLGNLENKHYYVDMDTKTPSPTPRQDILKKNKVSRTPPALPPKPANLVSKFKIQTLMSKSCENLDSFSAESEPDYCSISELNLPPQKMIMSPTNKEKTASIYDPISLDAPFTNLKAITQDKNNMQAPKQPQVKNDRVQTNLASISQINMLKNKKETEIPKLPQVSEIIIPDENEENNKKIEHISQDNYIRNNSQLLKQRLAQSNDKLRGPIVIGSSVSSLISGFNNHILSEITPRKQKNVFSNFERSQSYEKQNVTDKVETPNFDKFDLSQNFEEFNLDECEIGEDFQSEPSDPLNYKQANAESHKEEVEPKQVNETRTSAVKSNTSVEIVRATKTMQNPQSLLSLQQLQKSLNCQRHISEQPTTPALPQNPEPSYEHFLECTGLSSKSILTPSRMLSNHKSMLKPKDIKLRSKFKSAIFEHSGGTIKYWSEPYL